MTKTDNQRQKNGSKFKRSERKIRNKDTEKEPAVEYEISKYSGIESESENYDTYANIFNPVRSSDMSVNAVHRVEAFVTVVIYHDEPKVKGPLRIKIDTGSGGNTRLLRTFKQMFGSIPQEEILQREPGIKLSSYTGDNIKGFGTIAMNWQLKMESPSKQSKFYI